MLTLPLVALKNLVVMPGMMIHFDVDQKSGITAIESAMKADQRVFAVTQIESETVQPKAEDLYAYGTVTLIKQVIKLPENAVRVLAIGERRAYLDKIVTHNGFDMAEILLQETEQHPSSEEEEAMLRVLKDYIGKFSSEQRKINPEAVKQLLECNNLEKLMQQIPIQIPLNIKQKEMILSADGLVDCFHAEAVILASEVNIEMIHKELQGKIRDQLDKRQREYMLHEQLKLIQDELGEDYPLKDTDQFLEKCEQLEASEEIKAGIRKEIKRMKVIAGSSSEMAVARAYVETLLSLPWDKKTEEFTDVVRAEAILERDHYGLKKVKERILENLAVRAALLKAHNDGKNDFAEVGAPILCLVGPPGTGKTSIARSIAEALNKKYVRICLGGVRDEAEIRGHRRTYVGAMPGRLVQALKQAGVSNPLILLDEIDKMSSDYKGDPSSALLEVLDSEQNSRFTDHYIELPVNLSQVMFVATANSLSTIPAPLLDRMEVIEVNSYTEKEKLHIAKEHLVKKQRKKNAMSSTAFSITDKTLEKIIYGYTHEAGVRGLERKIGECIRKALLETERNPEKKSVRITPKNLEEYLGPLKYEREKKNVSDEVGIVRGLAVTGAGGDTLSIEINVMPGKGAIEMTGKLGDVMKESAKTAVSYVRSIAEDYKVNAEFFEKHDIHLHIPEGAIPKDGPSAGIALATALLSAVTGKKVAADLAMTGEITLRGRVLPIGGVKEKLLAAKLAGITKVIFPEKNRSDVEELEQEITDGMTIIFAKQMDTVIKEALV